MSHKKKRKGPAPVPPANQPHAGPALPDDAATEEGKQTPSQPNGGADFQEQDAKRRLGNFESAGEHAFVQPGGKNDANH